MSDAAAVGLEAGAILDRYELLCAIARGGMAHVWLARLKGKRGFEKLVAVKTILPEHALEQRFQRMFLDEAQIASGIDHPNVAKILELGEWRDYLYMVMEYVDGDSLSRLRRSLDKRGLKIPTNLALRMLSDVCAGLHAAHELKGADGTLLHVVHRDVSPQNVLIPINGSAKLIDFGVAKARDRLGDETSAGHTKGKSRYMPPEQALGKPIDRRADVFAIGAMAYELFTGNTPYDGPTDIARLHALITGEDVKSVPNAPHPAIEKLILNALARDPEKRTASASDVRTAIEDAMVKMRIRASVEDVAAFVKEHTAERIAERARVVKLALDAAAQRGEFRAALEKSSLKSSPQLDDPQSISDIDLPVVGAMPERAGQTGASQPPPPPGILIGPPPAEPASTAGDSRPSPVVTPYNTALEVPTADEIVLPTRRRGSMFAVFGVLAVALIIGLSAVAVRAGRGPVPASSDPRPLPSATALTTFPPIPPPDAVPSETQSASTAPAATSARPVTTMPSTKPTTHPTTHPTTKPTASVKPKGTDVVIQ